MAQQDFPSNSKGTNPNKPAPKAEPQKRAPLQSVVKGNVVVKRASIGSRIKATFAGEDGKTVLQAVIIDVIVPSMKDMFFQTITQSADRMLFGNEGGRRAPGRTSNGVRIDYNAISKAGKSIASRYPGRDFDGPDKGERARHDFSRIYFDSRSDALGVLDQLSNQISQYGWVSVSDFYDLAGITGDFQDEKWGWDNIASARPQPVSGGHYVLVMPAPVHEAN